MTSYLREIPDGEYLLESPPPERYFKDQGVAVMTRRAIEDVDEYAWSTPTAPSTGRVYRRLHKDPDGVEDMPYLFIVVDAPDGDGQLHIPHRVLVVD